MLIREVQADHYRIPLPVALSDSTHGVIAEPLRLDDGRAIAPERPGHGIEFDRAALERLRA